MKTDILQSFSSITELFAFAAALAPGFLILIVRSLYVTGRNKTVAQFAGEYFLASSIYYAVVLPFLPADLVQSEFHYFILILLVPLMLGLLAGLNAKSGFGRKILGLVSLEPIHPAPTAWDYLFGFEKKSAWVVVGLKDGSLIEGYYDSTTSFASSDLEKRDIYISHVEGECQETHKRGIWIAESEIRTIEFLTEKARK